MAENKKHNVLTRIAAALVLAPLTIGLLYMGFPYATILLLFVGTLLAWEWSKMLAGDDETTCALTYSFAMTIAVLVNPFYGVYSFYGIFLSMLCGAVFLFWKTHNKEHCFLKVLGVPYIAVGIGSLMWIYQLVGFEGILWFLILVWSVDIGGYVVGSTLRGPKLAPKISPNKTWAGLFGGMLFAAVASYFYAQAFDWARFENYALIAMGLAVFEQIGDLVESAIKRHLGLKDSSNLIPGHGGVFDRVDGLIFTAPILYLLLLYFPKLF